MGGHVVSPQTPLPRAYPTASGWGIQKIIIKLYLYLIRETERSDSILPHSTFPPGRRPLWPLRAGGRLPHSSNVVSYKVSALLWLRIIDMIDVLILIRILDIATLWHYTVYSSI